MLSEDKLLIGGNDDLNDYCKRKKESYTVDRHGHMIIYQTEDGLTKIDANIQDDTVWLSLSQMADLFQKDKSTISRHIRNIFSEGELLRDTTVAKFATVQNEGDRQVEKAIDYYNLDVIISVGHRVKSPRGVQFRIWASGILKEYIKKGFAMDDHRLKGLGGGGYFKELLERIRNIRASEKVFYRQILEIYATSIDYNPKADVSIQFFKKVQNKIHYAVSGETAAEILYHRADAEKEFMGLMNFSGDQPTLQEVRTAKNYLDEKELRVKSKFVCKLPLDFISVRQIRELSVPLQCGAVPYVHWIPTTLNGFACLG